MLKEALKNSPNEYLLFDENGSLLYATLQGNFLQNIQLQLKKELPSCLTKEKRSFFITVANKLYAVSAHFVENALTPYLIFCITPSKLPVNHSKYGIAILNREDAQNQLTKSLSATGPYEAENVSSTLMFTGEYGTEQNELAYFYYIKSSLCNHPLYKINCDLLNEKNWNFLTNSVHSPFTDSDNTIYISNLEKLPIDKQKLLLSVILDTNAHIRNRFIFSCCTEYKKPAPAVAMEYANALDSLIIPVIPLREQKTALSSMCALYMNTLNETLGKQIIALDDDAAHALAEYDYPGNHAQLKRILKQAVMKTNSLYLSSSVIRDILIQEKQLFPTCFSMDTSLSFQPDLNQSLDEINRSIIQQVLKNCNGNQSVAARKLGISRTTLWRSLNRD
ncbi:MAG: helix-turn-helix domain-containing protein [Blautia sp.]